MAQQNLDSINKTKLATDPYANIAVFASAGSGKTYLLVHRILKLLLSGVTPAHILAITFTRKAAAEMLERLMKVLSEWAAADDSQLITILKDLSHSYDPDSIAKARKLYEELLFSEQEIRITTFHAFCQDILKRFAIHAGVPAGFRVIENNFDLKQDARKQLFKLAQSEDENKLSEALFILLKHSNSVHNVNNILDTFIDSRSDWLSYTEHQADPVEYAEQHLRDSLFTQEFDQDHFIKDLTPSIKEYFSYLSQHSTKTNISHCEKLASFLELYEPEKQEFEKLAVVFFTTKLERRKLKASKTLENKLGAEKMHQFLSLHEELCEQFERYLDFNKKQALFEFNLAWYYAGQRILEIYQELKFKQHSLDFDDLEWYTYLLLNQHDSAAWIQYKLDQRIQHILIDEFQDTNPTQWKLISPLLNELALDAHDNHRSLFFVGDAKQSIYGFRRANSELQFTAAKWAEKNLNAQKLETDDSYRSSPAVIDFVNQVFSQQGIELEHFNAHQAVQSKLWGGIEVEPLLSLEEFQTEEQPKQEHYFRDPFSEAPVNAEYDCHYLESKNIAQKILSLKSNNTAVAAESGPRTLQFSDIMILARSRTHLAQLELALEEQNIPYSSTYDKEFLNTLEVQDILALLTYLTQNHNDLALAQVLRSPLYGMSDEDLMQIAQQTETTWHEKLHACGLSGQNQLAMQAYEQLQQWRNMANTLPVHDLLDQIYFQTNLLERYSSSIAKNPDTDHEHASDVLENLTTLLQLSLDLDAGRYSSIQSFLHALQQPNASNTFAKSLQKSSHDAVQIMTIHSAKGLEAPVVFLIDTGPQQAKSRTYQTIINWPSQADKPEQFLILGKKSEVDADTQKVIEQQDNKEQLEELNLLYVALTRAKQYLFISGSATRNNSKNSWHAIITASLGEEFGDQTWLSSYGIPPSIKEAAEEKQMEPIISGFDLSKPFDTNENEEKEIQTSGEDETQDEALAKYGTLIHKIFELIDLENQQDESDLKVAIEFELDIHLEEQEFNKALLEVKNCLQNPDLANMFSPKAGAEIIKEVPISFIHNNKTHNRIIDHLIIDETSAWIIDYKTTRDVSKENMQQSAEKYLKQINSYCHAVNKLYPNKTIRASILFTSIPALYDYEL